MTSEEDIDDFSTEPLPPEAPPATPAAAPAKPSGAERRQAVRRRLKVTSRLVFANKGMVEAITLDVSAGGMGVVSGANFPAGITCTIYFPLPRDKARPIVHAEAKVVHSVFSREEGGFKLGLQFTRVPPEMLDLIQQYIRD